MRPAESSRAARTHSRRADPGTGRALTATAGSAARRPPPPRPRPRPPDRGSPGGAAAPALAHLIQGVPHLIAADAEALGKGFLRRQVFAALHEVTRGED